VMPCCCDCRFWHKPSQERSYANFNIDMGECRNPKMFNGKDSERIVIDTSDIKLPPLFTGCAFGCCHWEPKSETTE
jgi:hypothetical protein